MLDLWSIKDARANIPIEIPPKTITFTIILKNNLITNYEDFNKGYS